MSNASVNEVRKGWISVLERLEVVERIVLGKEKKPVKKVAKKPVKK